ncbi:MAG: DUF1573 domain-containing protein [Candidatus Zixiibacteriota bacterium]
MLRSLIAPVAVMLTVFALSSQAQERLNHDAHVFDFGHVGIDFNVFHDFILVNVLDYPITITKVEVSCDCSTVATSDSTLLPGDTATFMLTFNTRDYYGPTNKSFTVFTDDPKHPKIEYSYSAIAGQWFHNLQPDPISLFFLPGKRGQKVKIANRKFDEIKLGDYDQFDGIFSVKILKKEAENGEFIELEVEPSSDLGKGTYLTSLTLLLDKDGEDKPTILTIPIKIVRY